MKKWPRLNDIFSLQPSVDPQTTESAATSANDNHWQKTKFDNTVRLWIALPTYLACTFLWAQGAITSLIPMTIIFATYGALHFLSSWLLMKSNQARKIDFLFATYDLAAMSLAVFSTGGVDSPLYFIYFIPLVVHAFHRDMGIVVYSGFGGVVLYALATFLSLTERTPAMLTNIGARLFFMLLTVGISCLALRILRRKDAVDKKRIHRLKNLTMVSEALNKMTTLNDRPDITQTIVQLINEGLGTAMQPWTKFFFVQQDSSLMRAAPLPSEEGMDFIRDIPTLSCPAMKNNAPSLVSEEHQAPECPTKQFPFGSHACMPIGGAENEVFGVLFVGSHIPSAFKEQELQFLEFIAKSFGLCIQRLHRMDELRKSLEMNSWVMAASIASSRSAAKTYEAVLDGIESILKADIVDLTLSWPDPNTSELVRSRGGEMPLERAVIFKLQTLAGATMGTIRAAQKDPDEKISSDDFETASTFAARAALSIENALTHETQRAQIELYQREAEKKQAA